MKRKKILFVCTGNTCRSPMAEALLRDKIKKNKIKYTVMGYATDEIMDTIYEIIEILDKDDKLKINIKNIG